jgi:hypothetical protein
MCHSQDDPASQHHHPHLILFQDIAHPFGPAYVRFMKIKPRVGITGNELADRLAK